jgi:hypothetical protein
MTRSAPQPPTIARTAAMRASGVVNSSRFTVASAPNFRQSASRGCSGAPTTVTRPAPISLAAAVASTPIGPEPWITTAAPQGKAPIRCAREKARMHEVSGSDSDARRSGMSSGSR